MDNKDYIEKLEKRIHNLEVAFMTMIALSEDHCAPALARDLDSVGHNLYTSCESLGGYPEGRHSMESHETD